MHLGPGEARWRRHIGHYQLTAGQLVEHHLAGEQSDAAVGSAAPLMVRDHFLETDRRLVMQVAVRFSMRRSERRDPPP